MRRLFISDRRTLRWSREILSGAVPETASTADPYFLVSERMALIDALAGLGPRQRATLVLRFREDRSVEDVGPRHGQRVLHGPQPDRPRGFLGIAGWRAER
ncbi:hypothetical protein [Sphaerisporangium album]|uniref:hypothetical protein n=1 Tax=Sphaerisporangium album TaxID=509200 RepID=UPI001FE9B245|nr:hypothetical protein [Sphaerisporangium album]